MAGAPRQFVLFYKSRYGFQTFRNKYIYQIKALERLEFDPFVSLHSEFQKKMYVQSIMSKQCFAFDKFEFDKQDHCRLLGVMKGSFIDI